MSIRTCLAILLACFAVWHVSRAMEPAAKDGATLDQRYAQTYLSLAETNLQRVQQINARVAHVISANVAADYAADVETAKARLAEAAAPAAGADSLAFWLRPAEASVRSAEAAWKSAVRANERKADTVDALEVQRLRLLFELAQLNVERGRQAVGKSPEVQLRWQLSLLHDDVAQLKEYVYRNPPTSRAYPLWRY